jgi:C-terminal processing protease CtpA/Prc
MGNPYFHRRWFVALGPIAPGLLACALAVVSGPALCQDLSDYDRKQAGAMLDMVRGDLVEYYYDPAFHGLALDDVFGAARAEIGEAATHAQMFKAIAKPLLQLDDSHTYFVPPAWAAKIEFGWQPQMIGSKCYVTAVEPGGGAEAAGLKKGDEVLSVDGMAPSRARMFMISYFHRLLEPRRSTLLQIRSPGGKPREIVVPTKVTQQKRLWTSSTDLADAIRELKEQAHLGRHRILTFAEDLVIWKMTGFDLETSDIKRQISKFRDVPAMILDMRGNPGGAVETLQHMLGGFLGEPVKIGDEVERDRKTALMTKKNPKPHAGKLVILIDSDSASAAEIFARVMQLEKRATVVGDQSAGDVMVSRYYSHQSGTGTAMYFGTSITVADIIMTDGKSLEHAGVTPDELLLPTAEDLAADRDPVLARAVTLSGLEMDPARAGTLFPPEW